MTNAIAVCILFYQKLEQTIECINSFCQGPIKVYVLNNGSDIKSFIRLKSRFKTNENIFFFDAGENLGPARGRNYLIERITEPWIVLADNDITVSPKNWAMLLLNNIAAKPDTEIFLPKLFNVHENGYAHYHPFYLEYDQIFDTYFDSGEIVNACDLNWFPSGASIVKKTFFDEIGVFDDNLFAFEDYELGIRCMLKGKELNMKYIEDITFVHDHKFQALKKDKLAVLHRYDSNKLQDSFIYIENKFNIKLNHNWKYWSNSQINLMTKTESRKFVERIISKLINYFK